MLQIVRFRHVAITVVNLELMLDFYTQDLGFQLKKRFEIQNEDFRKGIGIADAKARGVHISIPNCNVEIELFQFTEPHHQSFTSSYIQGFHHIAFVVDDLKKTYSDLTAKGVKFISEPVTMKEPAEVAGFQFAYFLDPEGNIIEINELPKGF